MLSAVTDLTALLRALWREKWLFIAASVLLWIARLQLSLLKYGDPRRQSAASVGKPAPALPLARRVAWNVERAARLVPGATCLVRAMAGQRLLALKGYGSTIQVGVCRTGSMGFEAHAWLISGDLLVLGGEREDLRRFTTLIGNSQ